MMSEVTMEDLRKAADYIAGWEGIYHYIYAKADPVNTCKLNELHENFANELTAVLAWKLGIEER
ncbi:MAG: hypothetical protein JAY60_19590 [Candidatus Thiodiazotropha weberae]|nr:hypothetical protein [Candidatus Thiodiazotropha weberae]